MKKGFTLIEILVVISLLAIISVLVITNITNSVNKQKNELNASMKSMILSAAEEYVGNSERLSSKKTDFCVSLDELINNNYVEKSVLKSNGGQVEDKTKILVLNGKEYTIDTENLCKVKVYGLRWDGNETYTRLEDAEGMVANAGVGNSVATNDFDSAEIYKDIADVEVDGNMFVKIPKFYIRKVVTGDTWEWYVSKEQGEGYYLPECFKDESGNELDYVLIGKYDASLNGTKLESKSGATPAVNISMDTSRTYATNNNVNGITGYQLFDIHAYDVVQVLFYIEFATVDSQSVMYGYCASTNTTKINNGTTDIVVSTSGSTTSNSDGLSAMKYRGIENLWGNIYQWIDGLYISNSTNVIYVNKKPSTYANYSSTQYYSIGYELSGSVGFISKMNYDANNPFIQLPKEGGSLTPTKYADFYFKALSRNTIMGVGGYWLNNSIVGITAIDVSNTPTLYDDSFGTRIMKKPL